MSTTVYTARVDVLLDDTAMVMMVETVDETRRRKIDRLRFAADRRLSLGAALLLRRALAHEGILEATLAYDEHGKPYLSSHPHIHISVSHSGHTVMCAVSDDAVGCDVQVRRDDVNLAIAQRHFSPEEARYVNEGDDAHARNCRFFALWTQKESWLKADGRGLSRLRDARLCDAAQSGWHFRIFERDEETLAVCARSPHIAEPIELDLLSTEERLMIAARHRDQGGFTCVAANGRRLLTSTRRGVAPLLDWRDDHGTLDGFVAADKVVGKGAAFVYLALQISAVHAAVISRPALELLQQHRVTVMYDTLVPAIRNRAGDGFCPIETAVMDAASTAQALAIIDRMLQRS